MQMLTLQSSSTIGITDAELGRALTFEAESLSGLSALDSETGFVPLGSQGGQSHFWIVQLPRWQRDQIDEAIRQAGGIPAGVGHPAGVPTSLGDSGGPWRRVELWSNAVVAIEGDGDKVQRTNVINANPRGKTWFDELAAWRTAGNGAAREEWLTEDLSLATLADDANSVAGLETDEPLTRYLSGWSRTVGRKAAVPLIVPEARPLSKQQRSTIAAGLALVVGAVAFADYTIVQRKIQAASETTKGIKAKAAQLASFNKQITDTDKQREKEAKDRDAVQGDVQSTQTALASHRYRWSKLLDLLAERCPNHLMVDRISSGNGKLILSGLSLGPDAANRLATVLGGELRELGWQVQPARKEASK
jgi:Tfp pilus assembly protein PilN